MSMLAKKPTIKRYAATRKMQREELSVYQRHILDVIEDEVGVRFDHSHENLTLLCQVTHMTLPNLRREMQDLIYKGFLRREVREYGAPRRWVLVGREDDDADVAGADPYRAAASAGGSPDLARNP